jgi:hypothetical protein
MALVEVPRMLEDRANAPKLVGSLCLLSMV